MPRKRTVPPPSSVYFGRFRESLGFAKKGEAEVEHLLEAKRGNARAVLEVWKQFADSFGSLRPEDIEVLVSALRRLSQGARADKAFMPAPKDIGGLPPGPERKSREREAERREAADQVYELLITKRAPSVHAAAVQLSSSGIRKVRWYELSYKEYGAYVAERYDQARYDNQ